MEEGFDATSGSIQGCLAILIKSIRCLRIIVSLGPRLNFLLTLFREHESSLSSLSSRCSIKLKCEVYTFFQPQLSCQYRYSGFM